MSGDWAFFDPRLALEREGFFDRESDPVDAADFDFTMYTAWSPPPDNSWYGFARIRDDTLKIENEDPLKWWRDDTLSITVDSDHSGGSIYGHTREELVNGQRYYARVRPLKHPRLPHGQAGFLDQHQFAAKLQGSGHWARAKSTSVTRLSASRRPSTTGLGRLNTRGRRPRGRWDTKSAISGWWRTSELPSPLNLRSDWLALVLRFASGERRCLGVGQSLMTAIRMPVMATKVVIVHLKWVSMRLLVSSMRW